MSFMHDVIKEYDEGFIGGQHWIESPPEMWNDDRMKIFDMMNELESKLKSNIIDLIVGEGKI